MYKRALLKLSGEQLAGEYEFGVDPTVVAYLAEEVKKAVALGCQIVLIVGGGNMVRGAEVAGNGIRPITAHHMGMLSGLINCLAVADIFQEHGVPTHCLSNLPLEKVAETYTHRLAEKYLQKNRVVIVAGGSGRAYVTHDTAAVMFALELDCEVALKATKVEGIYDKDPSKFDDAQLVSRMTFAQAVSDGAVTVMDKAALGLALENHKSIIVFNPMKPGNLAAVVAGEAVGTLVSD